MTAGLLVAADRQRRFYGATAEFNGVLTQLKFYLEAYN